MVCQLHINKTVLKREREIELSLITLCCQPYTFPQTPWELVSLTVCVSLSLTGTRYDLFLFSSSLKNTNQMETLFPV